MVSALQEAHGQILNLPACGKKEIIIQPAVRYIGMVGNRPFQGGDVDTPSIQNLEAYVHTQGAQISVSALQETHCHHLMFQPVGREI